MFSGIVQPLVTHVGHPVCKSGGGGLPLSTERTEMGGGREGLGEVEERAEIPLAEGLARITPNMEDRCRGDGVRDVCNTLTVLSFFPLSSSPLLLPSSLFPLPFPSSLPPPLLPLLLTHTPEPTITLPTQPSDHQPMILWCQCPHYKRPLLPSPPAHVSQLTSARATTVPMYCQETSQTLLGTPPPSPVSSKVEGHGHFQRSYCQGAVMVIGREGGREEQE